MNETVIVRRPQVAQEARKIPAALVIAAIAVLGLSIFLWLSVARAASRDKADDLPGLVAMTATDTTVPPPPVQVTEPAPTGGFFIPKNGPVTLTTTPAPIARSGYSPSFSPSAPAVTPVDPMRDRLRAPTLVVDLAQATPITTPGVVQPRTDGSTEDARSAGAVSTTVSTTGSTTQPTLPGTPVGNDPGSSSLSDSERFASRVGKEEVEVAAARQMVGLDRLILQGAVIAAVMETALNSDLPGYARAIITREVRSFDGSTVLISPGSRVIGQYKSGVAQGASRVFVVWTRLIRPDGVSIELASPTTDELGRAGIGGKTNSHFFARFGGAILTSVLSGAINAAAASLSQGSTIVVSSANQASGLASQAGRNTDIPPTITTRQGATVRIFVARDLDFSRVGPVR